MHHYHRLSDKLGRHPVGAPPANSGELVRQIVAHKARLK